MKSQQYKADQQRFKLRAVVKRGQKTNSYRENKNEFLMEARAELSVKDEQE